MQNEIYAPRIDTENIKKFIRDNRDTITIDYSGGSWIVENTSFVAGNNPPVKISGVASTLEDALDNFAYHFHKLNYKHIDEALKEEYHDYY